MKCERHGRAQNAVCERCAEDKHSNYTRFLESVIRDMTSPETRLMPRDTVGFAPDRWHPIQSIRGYHRWVAFADERGILRNPVSWDDAERIKTELWASSERAVDRLREKDSERYAEACEIRSSLENALRAVEAPGWARPKSA